MNNGKQTIQDISDVYNGMRVYIGISIKGGKLKRIRGVIKVDKSNHKHLLVDTNERRSDLSKIKKSYGSGTKILPLNLDIPTKHLMNDCVILC